MSRPNVTRSGMSRLLLLDIDECPGAISTLAERISVLPPRDHPESFAGTLSRRPIRRASAAFDITGDARQIVIPAHFAMVIALESRIEADVLKVQLALIPAALSQIPNDACVVPLGERGVSQAGPLDQ